MSVQAELHGKEICRLFPLKLTERGEELAVFGFVENAYSNRFGRPSFSKSTVIVVNPVAMSAAVNPPPCHAEYGELIVTEKLAVVNRLSLPANLTVKLEVPAVLGVPVMVPLLPRTSSGEKLPESKVHV